MHQLFLPYVPFSFRGVALASDTKGPGSIFSNNLIWDVPLLSFNLDNGDGSQFEILDINLGYTPSGDPKQGATMGCALNIQYANAGRIRVSVNNAYNGIYAGVCRGCEIE